MHCTTNNQQEYQSFPKAGILAKNLNRNVSYIKNILEANRTGELYAYFFSTIELNEDNLFIQNGCAPNWQGDFITLCTCKHNMRTKKKDFKDWENVWIAGLKNSETKSYFHLVYLMKVEKSFETVFDLWEYLPKKTRMKKNSRTNMYGDLFKPRTNLLTFENKINSNNYFQPINSHKHFSNWQEDICTNYNNKYPSFLLGKQDNSFLWEKPKIILKHPDGKSHWRNYKVFTINEFIQNIK